MIRDSGGMGFLFLYLSSLELKGMHGWVHYWGVNGRCGRQAFYECFWLHFHFVVWVITPSWR